jgi:uncharacterized protein YodC (DUF2158 family)
MAHYHGFKIDELVFLASGGPPMKVIGVSPNGRIWCQWDCGGITDEASFFPEMLRRAT